MDNKAYLDQIAVKGNKGMAEPLLSPLMIKIIVAGIIALITIVIVGNILNSSNAKTTALYERLYSRINNLHGNNGPFKTYSKKLRSADLIAYASDLETSLTDTGNKLNGVISSLGVKTSAISKEVSSSESSRISNFKSKVDEATFIGTIDPTFATALSAEIDQLMVLERQVRTKTNNTSLVEILDTSLNDLTIIYDKIHDLSMKLN